MLLQLLSPSQLPSKELVTRMQMAKEMKQMEMNKKKGYRCQVARSKRLAKEETEARRRLRKTNANNPTARRRPGLR
jgi:hypothetical protein